MPINNVYGGLWEHKIISDWAVQCSGRWMRGLT
jgi:hypothetical protein